MVSLELCKVLLRLDQPTAALQQYAAASERHPGDIALLLGAARVHDALDQTEEALASYHQVRRTHYMRQLSGRAASPA